MTSVDVSSWQAAGEEYLGTKPKQWLRSPAGELWLWKESTIHNDARHGAFRKGDDWSELVASRVGQRLGLPVAKIQLATRGDKFGVISRKVFDDENETLVHGNELLAEAGIRPNHPRDRSGYTVEAVARVLDGVTPPVKAGSLATAFEWFAGYLLLDTVIGNTDRHQDNWGIIRGASGSRLSPSFDHASCLGFQISDAERLETLQGGHNRNITIFAARAKTKFEGGPSPLAATVSAMAVVTDTCRAHWVERLEGLGRPDELVEDLPEDRMSAAAKLFASSLLAENLAVSSPALRTMVS